jgi:hypothetical protein
MREALVPDPGLALRVPVRRSGHVLHERSSYQELVRTISSPLDSMELRILSRAATSLVVAFVVVACTDQDTDAGPSVVETPSITPAESPTVASPTPPALPDEPPPTRGEVASDCENGWATPREGSSRYGLPLGVIRRATAIDGPLVVVDMRYFEGPESPPSDKGYLLVVQRWYVKLYAEHDLSFQGRFLVERRRFGRGLVAVAPYDSTGFRSPDWIGFQYESSDPQDRYYEGLPGLWSGIAYDFVRGDPDAGLSIPGLPEQVAGCLDAS